jgi:hypothetical protein
MASTSTNSPADFPEEVELRIAVFARGEPVKGVFRVATTVTVADLKKLIADQQLQLQQERQGDGSGKGSQTNPDAVASIRLIYGGKLLDSGTPLYQVFRLERETETETERQREREREREREGERQRQRQREGDKPRRRHSCVGVAVWCCHVLSSASSSTILSHRRHCPRRHRDRQFSLARLLPPQRRRLRHRPSANRRRPWRTTTMRAACSPCMQSCRCRRAQRTRRRARCAVVLAPAVV